MENENDYDNIFLFLHNFSSFIMNDAFVQSGIPKLITKTSNFSRMTNNIPSDHESLCYVFTKFNGSF